MFYPEDIPYMKVVKKVLSLPKGNPIGRDNLVFLMSKNRNESYDIINDEKNLKPFKNYRYYFYNLRYRGKVNNKTYNINHIPERREIRIEVENKTNMKMFPLMSPSMGNDNHGLFFDLSEYLKIFFSLTDRVVAIRKATMFWNFMKSILKSEELNRYHEKLVVCNIDNFKTIKGPLSETMENPVFILYYTLFKDYTLLSDLDIDFIFYSGTYNLKVNPSKCDKDSYRFFMIELKKLYKYANVTINDEFDDSVIMKQERQEAVVNEIKKSFNFTGEQPVEGTITKLPEKEKKSSVEEKIEKKVKESDKNVESVVKPKTKSENQIATKAVKTDVENSLENDEEIIRELYKTNQSKKVTKSAASTARDELLRQKQEDIVVKNMTVRELKRINSSNVNIPSKDISSAVKTTNENMKKVRFNQFNETYIDNVMTKDITNAIMSLNDKSLPIYVRNIKVEDTSDELNYIDTYTIELEDANRQRSTIKVDIPKFIDNKFMWLGGNKKLILNQNFLLPVVKTSPDTVQIVTNYNKMFIQRDDVKSLGTIERLTKFISQNEDFAKSFKVGSAFDTNNGYITTIEYDELSRLFTEYKHNQTHLFFDQSEANEYAKQNGIKIPSNNMFIGMSKKEPVFIEYDKQTDSYGNTIIDIIFDDVDEELRNKFAALKTSKRLMYAKVKTMEKMIPVMVLLSFWEGFSTVLKKMGAEYRLSDTYPKNLYTSESVLKFKDCYFIYQDNALSSLLINGMRQIKTEDYNIADMDTKEPYFDVLKKIYGKISIANALDNSYEFTIDPITKEILQDLNLPTEIVELMIYAVRLLADNQYKLEIDASLSRIRCVETIPAILYDSLAKNYITYKNSNGRKKFSVPQDCVIKNLLKLKTVEDYSTLNPILEMERTHAVSAKGWRGINLDDSFTVEKRSYDPSMIGIIGLASSPDGSVGVSRTLTLEPNIKGARGYVDIKSKEELKDVKDVNLFSPAELSIPLGATRDDPTRLGCYSVKNAWLSINLFNCWNNLLGHQY